MNPEVEARIREIGSADIVVVIPSLNNVSTIAYVIYQVSKGLEQHFPDKKSVIINVDGGSNDGTMDVARVVKCPQDKIVYEYTPYKGVAGKGSSMKSAFNVAGQLDAQALVMVDSDLRSITPEWIKLLAGPCITGESDQVAPYYSRHKYDGTITNFITHPMIQMLFGKRIRQPIGGDFGFSKKAIQAINSSPLWEREETLKFGIDIFQTGTTLGEGLNITEAILGVKIHDPKDPGADLQPMFRQVVGSLCNIVDKYKEVWMDVGYSQPVRRHRGNIRYIESEPIEVHTTSMIDRFLEARNKYSSQIESVLPHEISRRIITIPDLKEEFIFEADLWVDTVFHLTSACVKADEESRKQILDMFCGIWLGRVAYFTIESKDMNDREAEHLIKDQALIFEEKKQEYVELFK